MKVLKQNSNYQTIAKKPKSKFQLTQFLEQQETHTLWLSGYSMTEISTLKNVSLGTVSGQIRKFRKQLYEESKASLEEHTEHSVAVLKNLQTQLWEVLWGAVDDRVKITTISELRRLEETIARVRGIIQNKNITNVVKELKVYDFKDTFPAPNIIVDKPELEEGSTHAQQELLDATPDSEPIIEEIKPHRAKPTYDDDSFINLPDDTIAEVLNQHIPKTIE